MGLTLAIPTPDTLAWRDAITGRETPFLLCERTVQRVEPATMSAVAMVGRSPDALVTAPQHYEGLQALDIQSGNQAPVSFEPLDPKDAGPPQVRTANRTGGEVAEACVRRNKLVNSYLGTMLWISQLARLLRI